jgi:hypothetical protein
MIPIELAAIAIHVAIFMAQFSPLVSCGGVVSVVEIAAQVAAIVSDPILVVTDIAVQAAVTIPSQRRGYSHSNHQENPSNRAFHSVFPPTAIRG